MWSTWWNWHNGDLIIYTLYDLYYVLNENDMFIAKQAWIQLDINTIVYNFTHIFTPYTTCVKLGTMPHNPKFTFQFMHKNLHH
jgi:hypothetical protein